MNTTSAARPRLAALAALAALACAALPAQAQQIYRSVGPDGRTVFSDQPPPAANRAVGRNGEAVTETGPSLPYALRQVADRFPVTLYTGNGCAPCATGRNLLTARGIPFRERIVSTPDDIEALQRLAGDAGLPLLTIGGQQIKGFAEPEWVQFLDAAGYPKISQLPSGYRNPPPAPLVARTEAAPPPAPAAAPAAPVNGAPAPAPSNPAGIRF